jgi:predicted ester cyclase
MAASESESIVRDQVRLLNEGDAAGSAATFADPSLNHGMSVPRAGIEAVFRSLRTAVPDLHIETIETVSDGEVVATRVTLTGTHLGMPELPFVQGGVFATVEPVGAKVEMLQMHFYRVRDGKIIEHWAVRDDLTLARQLGVVGDPVVPPTRP